MGGPGIGAPVHRQDSWNYLLRNSPPALALALRHDHTQRWKIAEIGCQLTWLSAVPASAKTMEFFFFYLPINCKYRFLRVAFIAPLRSASQVRA